jgi:hypothetical protein
MTTNSTRAEPRALQNIAMCIEWERRFFGTDPKVWIPDLIAAAGPEVTETYIDFFTATIDTFGIIWPNSFGDIWHTCTLIASVLLGRAPFAEVRYAK